MLLRLARGARKARWIGLVISALPATASAAQQERFFPLEAFLREVEGSAMLRCRPQRDGRVTDCTVLSETPGGYGFGRQALKMAPLVTLPRNSIPADGQMVQLPIGFKLDGEKGATRKQRPEWTSVPGDAEMKSVFPPKAVAANLSGAALVQCHEFASGELLQCRAVSEAPTGYDFGLAAEKIAVKFKIKPTGRTRRPDVQIPILFQLSPNAVGFYSDLRCFWASIGQPERVAATNWFRARAVERMTAAAISGPDQDAWFTASEEDYNAEAVPSDATVRRCSAELPEGLR